MFSPFIDNVSITSKDIAAFCSILCICEFHAWIFTIIEQRSELANNGMERMLKDLRADIEIKFNITDNEFDSFVRRAAVAMTTGNEKDWNFWNRLDFVFTAITTIGKVTEIIHRGKG